MGLNSANDAVKHSEDYGDGYYVGTVINNNDPLGIGRVQANVPGLYNSAKGPVPWIGPVKDSPYGFGISATGPFGVYGSPAVNSQIKVELQKGDENNALYTPLPTVPSANPLFKAPTTWGFQDPSGNKQVVDMASGSWTWTHSSGDSISYDATGDRVAIVKGSSTETITGDLTQTVSGSATQTIDGSLNITVHGSANLTISGSAIYKAAVHQFQGPVTMDSTLSVAEDIVDNVAQGNTGSIKDFRTIYDEHDHDVVDVQGGGDTIVTTPPIPQVPNPQIS